VANGKDVIPQERAERASVGIYSNRIIGCSASYRSSHQVFLLMSAQ
jgi:hypothetical protein